MTRLWYRFAAFRWTLPLLLLSYMPSVLTFPFVVLATLPAFSRGEPGMLLFAVCTLLSFAVPAACAGAWLGRALAPARVSARAIRWLTFIALLAWLPHHAAVVVWGLFRAVRMDGLVP
jgi:hypothetical protein